MAIAGPSRFSPKALKASSLSHASTLWLVFALEPGEVAETSGGRVVQPAALLPNLVILLGRDSLEHDVCDDSHGLSLVRVRFGKRRTALERMTDAASSYLRRLLEPRLHGAAAWVPTVVALVTGVIFLSFGIGKFTDHASEAVDFKRYEVPFASLAVYAAGLVETVGGVLLVLGLLTRVAAAALALQMVAVVATAGRVEGGFLNLGVAPMLFVAMVFVVWAGPGAVALDRRLSSNRASGHRS